MPPANDELLPLINRQERTNTSFLSRSLQVLKKTTLIAAGAFSGYMYWPTSFQAAKFGGKYLQYLAAFGGSFTNGIFNIESFLNITELPQFKKTPLKYLTGTVIAFFCVLPIFLMNIEDDEGNYVDKTAIALQGFIASLNILVNLVGTIELIDSLSYLWKDKLPLEKSKLIKKIDTIISNFSHLNPEEQTPIKFLELINNKFKAPNLKQQLTQFSLRTSLGVISIPLILAYTFISYFDMEDFAEKKWHIESLESILLGVFIAIGNTIPSIGFLIKGINSCCEKLMPLQKPPF
ncbi:MAG: hypothetical protein REH83_02685, partial [Rickettsiella sp.]|nr:hypothetical protein [Rickettsiella sp.]